MVVGIVSMKGGVGKSTIATMFARFIAEQRDTPITVVDMDPQRGATVILLGPQQSGQWDGPTVYDVLASELDQIPSREIIRQAVRVCPYDNRISVVPSALALGEMAGRDTPRWLLRTALEDAPLDREATVIVDSGPEITLCEMSIAAADLVFIPITLSHQSGVPTLNTMQAILRQGRTVAGLIPSLVGNARWNQERVEEWRANLASTKVLKGRGIPVLPPMPFSPAVICGKWRWGKLPKRLLPMLDAMYAVVFGEHALDEGELGSMNEEEAAAEAVVAEETVQV